MNPVVENGIIINFLIINHHLKITFIVNKNNKNGKYKMPFFTTG